MSDPTLIGMIPCVVLNNIELSPKDMDFLNHLANCAMMSPQQLAAIYLSLKLEEESTIMAEIERETRIDEVPWMMSSDHTLQIASSGLPAGLGNGTDVSLATPFAPPLGGA